MSDLYTIAELQKLIQQATLLGFTDDVKFFTNELEARKAASA